MNMIKMKVEVVVELVEKGHHDLAQEVVGQKGGSWPYDKVITISDGGLSGRHQGPGMENASVIAHNKDNDKWYLIDVDVRSRWRWTSGAAIQQRPERREEVRQRAQGNPG
jgi:hypothetical protein